MNKNHPIYQVRLINPDQGLDTTISVSTNEFILDVAEQQGIALPYSCRAGSCINCAAKIIKGQIAGDNTFLKPEEEKAGFFLTCKSYPLSDCTILTHQEDDLLNL